MKTPSFPKNATMLLNAGKGKLSSMAPLSKISICKKTEQFREKYVKPASTRVSKYINSFMATKAKEVVIEESAPKESENTFIVIECEEEEPINSIPTFFEEAHNNSPFVDDEIMTSYMKHISLNPAMKSPAAEKVSSTRTPAIYECESEEEDDDEMTLISSYGSDNFIMASSLNNKEQSPRRTKKTVASTIRGRLPSAISSMQRLREGRRTMLFSSFNGSKSQFDQRLIRSF